MSTYSAVLHVRNTNYRMIHEVGKRVVTNMLQNPDLFQNPPLQLTVLNTQLDTYGDQITKYDGSKLQYQQLLDTCAFILKELKKLQSYTNLLANGEASIILKSGFECNYDRVYQTKVPAKVKIRKILDGPVSGSFKVIITVTERGNLYRVEVADADNPTVFRPVKNYCSSHKLMVENAEPGKPLLVRVVALNKIGVSDPGEPFTFIPR